MTRETIHELMVKHVGPEKVPKKFKIHTDTSDFFRVEYNDVVLLGNTPFWIKRYEKEGRFGLDDEPKYWVRRAVHLPDGTPRILKLVFHEKFETTIGGTVIKCFRSPKKEARILELVTNHQNFMHGTWLPDEVGNNVRILEVINGSRYDELIADKGADHHDYFHNFFSTVLKEYMELVLAIKFLHDHDEKHGDIRRDHIIRDRTNNINRWIDFDYNYMHGESKFGFDLQGLGNILIFLTGHGDILVGDLHRQNRAIFDTLWGEDLNISYKNRVANLAKIFPYIPDSLNRILLHFSQGARIFYDTTDQMLNDLTAALDDLIQLTGRQP